MFPDGGQRGGPPHRSETAPVARSQKGPGGGSKPSRPQWRPPIRRSTASGPFPSSPVTRRRGGGGIAICQKMPPLVRRPQVQPGRIVRRRARIVLRKAGARSCAAAPWIAPLRDAPGPASPPRPAPPPTSRGLAARPPQGGSVGAPTPCAAVVGAASLPLPGRRCLDRPAHLRAGFAATKGRRVRWRLVRHAGLLGRGWSARAPERQHLGGRPR